MDSREQVKEALQRAVQLLGSQAAVGRACQRKQQYVWNWLQAGRVPPECAPLIEKAIDALGCGQRVTKEALCPEFPWAELAQQSA